MIKVLESLKKFKNEHGAAAVEYGIMVALIACVIIVTVTTIGKQLNQAFTAVANALSAV